MRCAKVHAAAELFLTTHDDVYRDLLLAETGFIAAHAKQLEWIAARVTDTLDSTDFRKAIREALPALKTEFDTQCAETPYGIPYKP